MRARWVVGLFVVSGCFGGGHRPALEPDTHVDHLALGLAQFRHGDFIRAQLTLRQAQFELSPTQPEMAEVRYYIAECDFQIGDLDAAGIEFSKVAEEFPASEYAPLSMLRMGDAHLRQWRSPELDPSPGQTALATYQELIARYPNTSAAARAQSHVGDLNEWFALKDYQTGVFYFRRKAYDSAILYFKDVIANHQGTHEVVDALLKLVDSYRAIGYTDELRETCENLRQYYAKTPGLDARCPAAAVAGAP